jgi:hypothetical protein
MIYLFLIFYQEIFHDFIFFDVMSKTLLKILQEFGFNLFQPNFKKNMVCTSFYFVMEWWNFPQKQNICTNILSLSSFVCEVNKQVFILGIEMAWWTIIFCGMHQSQL